MPACVARGIFLLQRAAAARVAISDRRSRGEQDAIARIVKAAQGAPISANGSTAPEHQHLVAANLLIGDKKERAPKGTARALIDRVLAERGGRGVALSEILEAAKGMEKLASYSGVRFTLEQGREEHRYKHRDGKWYRVIPRERLDENSELPRGDSR